MLFKKSFWILDFLFFRFSVPTVSVTSRQKYVDTLRPKSANSSCKPYK